MSTTVRIDYRLAMRSGAGRGGLEDAELEPFLGRASEATDRLVARCDSGDLGFFRLPRDPSVVDDVLELVAGLPAGLTDAIVLGIGGSSLGARAVCDALLDPIPSAVHSGLRVHFPDNSDPHRFGRLIARLDPARTLVIVVSKSGGTLETAAQMHIAIEWLERNLGGASARDRVVAVTDPERGALRAFAEEKKFRTLPIPSNVGGRFSVLTAAGLLPVALAGLDVRDLLEGARDMMHACERRDARENPAAMLAALHAAHMRLRGHDLHVTMPYSDALRTFTAWHVQLWAESLGKRLDLSGQVVETGATPIQAVGATDQHAQVQLFVEGPRDKLVSFIRVERPTGPDPVVPPSQGPHAFIAGKSLHTILLAELEGTALALASDGRPSLTLEVKQLDAHTLGALFMLYETTTALMGDLLGVDPFDQPGVERGKRITNALLGGAVSSGDELVLQGRNEGSIYRVPVR